MLSDPEFRKYCTPPGTNLIENVQCWSISRLQYLTDYSGPSRSSSAAASVF